MEEEKTTTTGTERVQGPGCFFCTTALPLLEHCWSEAAKDHFRNSRIEFLKGIRSLIDDRISHLAREEQGKGTHVTVE
jgi:hypothetical protein